MKHIKLFEENQPKEGLEFYELSPAVQNQVIERERENVTDYDWWQDVVDEYKEKLNKLGWEKVEIEFTGFHSQGDGASFTASMNSPSQIIKFVKEVLELNYPDKVLEEVYLQIVRTDSRYFHENTIDSYCNWEGDEQIIEDYPFGPEVPFTYDLNEVCDEIEAKARPWARSFSKEIYRALEKEHDYLTCDDSVIDYIEANGFLFDENGRII